MTLPRSKPRPKSPKTVTVHDRMQSGYRYALTAREGHDFAPDFKPHLTPKQMLAMGVFGGRYMTDCRREFPASWFAHAKLAPAVPGSHGRDGLPVHRRDDSLNYFGVNASQPLSVWRAKGWINEAHDPRGWFQWYCRYYRGRRLGPGTAPDGRGSEDERQIGRWRAMARHAAQIRAHCRVGDFTCHTKQRQALLHWAYDARKM